MIIMGTWKDFTDHMSKHAGTIAFSSLDCTQSLEISYRGNLFFGFYNDIGGFEAEELDTTF